MLRLLLLLVPAPSVGQHCITEMDKLGSDLRAEMAVMLEQGWANTQVAVGMEARLEEKDAMMKEMKAELEERGTMDVPTVIICPYKRGPWTATGGSNLPYDRFITNFNKADRPNGGDGDLDLNTGIFTCLSAGHYTIHYSGLSHLDPGERVYLALYHNGQELEEGRWHEYDSGAASGVSSHSSLPPCRSCTWQSARWWCG
jgi:hypothetical protein